MRIIILLAFLLAACSPSKLIERAVKKDPSILQVDTVKIPTIEVDTFTIIEKDTILQTKLDSIIQYLPDTCTEIIRKEFYPILNNYTPVCIEDSLIYEELIVNDSLSLYLTLIAYQSNDSIYLKASLNRAEIYTNQIIITDTKLPIWVYFLIGFTILLVILLIKR